MADKDIKIDTGIPIPRKRSELKYPFGALRVGESLFVNNCTPGALSGSRQYAAQKYGFKFVMRTVEGGVRVWRIA